MGADVQERVDAADAEQCVDVTVVFPCLNEARGVAMCVTEARQAMRDAGMRGEVVVVDNGSTDGSPEFAAAAGARVVHEPRRGYGRALRTGFAHARAEVVVMADADGTYDLTKLPDVTAPVLADELDLNLATRLGGATRDTMPLLHRFVGTPVITFLTSRASGGRLTSDSQTGYRAFRRSAMAELGLTSNGMELASEMLIKAGRANLRIGNTEAGYRPRVGESKLNTWADGWRHLKLIVLLAPDIVLIGPGLTLAILGIIALASSFAQPAGLEIGSVTWQPVFFSGIAIVLGLQTFFAGAVVANASPVATRGPRLHSFLHDPRWPRRALALGVVLAVLGVLIDFVLFLSWLQDLDLNPTNGVGFGFAALAQSLLILGGSSMVVGVLARFARDRALDVTSGPE
jgi:hypothetical protein